VEEVEVEEVIVEVEVETRWRLNPFLLLIS